MFKNEKLVQAFKDVDSMLSVSLLNLALAAPSGTPLERVIARAIMNRLNELQNDIRILLSEDNGNVIQTEPNSLLVEVMAAAALAVDTYPVAAKVGLERNEFVQNA